jgi:hypothetical protein
VDAYPETTYGDLIHAVQFLATDLIAQYREASADG